MVVSQRFVNTISYQLLGGISPDLQICGVGDKDELTRF